MCPIAPCTYIQKIYNRLLIDLSYNSARLEGNTYTLADTEHLVIQGVSAPGKLDTARRIDDPFEQSFFLLGHVAYLQAFMDVNKRTARLASIIPLITQDYVPQSFVDVSKDDYLKAIIVFYELNDVRPLAELYCWAYRRSCLHFDTSVQVVGFDEIAARYRPLRRALVAELVRSLLPPEEVMRPSVMFPPPDLGCNR
jgi:Fic family protein